MLGVVTRLDLRRCSASLARDGSSSLAHVMRRATAQMPLLREIGVWDCDLSSGLEAAPLAALAKLSIRGCRLRGLPDALPVAGEASEQACGSLSVGCVAVAAWHVWWP